MWHVVMCSGVECRLCGMLSCVGLAVWHVVMCSECRVLVVCHVVICSGVECWLCGMLS